VDTRAQAPVLVVVAHPDDEALGFAGVIVRSISEGRRVFVAVVMNGDSGARGRALLRYCGAPRGGSAQTARYGCRRLGESRAALKVLGVHWDRDPYRSDIFFLGYAGVRLREIASSQRPLTGDRARLHHTYAEDWDGKFFTCNGDLRYLLEGRHSQLCAPDLARDMDSLLELTRPVDVYTHVAFDGHPDHAELNSQVVAAVERAGMEVTLHATLIHPEGTGDCMYASAFAWPNPAREIGGPYVERFTPDLDFEAPPSLPGSPEDVAGGRWGPLGEPNEVIEVPPAMRHPDPARNLKWRAISRYESQLEATPDAEGNGDPARGYLRAFVKRSEFFWTATVGG
jgi:LmbE family N-acetylglucosaminyl deacetylase